MAARPSHAPRSIDGELTRLTDDRCCTLVRFVFLAVPLSIAVRDRGSVAVSQARKRLPDAQRCACSDLASVAASDCLRSGI